MENQDGDGLGERACKLNCCVLPAISNLLFRFVFESVITRQRLQAMIVRLSYFRCFGWSV